MPNQTAIMELIKYADKSIAAVGDIITFKIIATNTGTLPIGNILDNPVYIYDTLPSDLEFVSGSISINGVNNTTLNINSGINIGILNSGESVTILFKSKVISNSSSTVYNTANGSFGYIAANGSPARGLSTSNTLSIKLDLASLDIKKSSSSDFVVLGDTVSYTISLYNNGTLNLSNVIFKDIIPPGTTLIDGSFKIDGVIVNKVNLEKGVNVGNIAINQTKTLVYSIKILTPNCEFKLTNKSSATFKYQLPDGTAGSGQSLSTLTSSVSIDLGISNFKQLSLEEYLQVPSSKPALDKINSVSGEIEIIKYHVIPTSKVTSNEGQSLTGYKLIINALLKEVVDYTACESSQSVHSAHYHIPFSTFIILPENYIDGSKIDIDAVVEDIYYTEIDSRVFFSNSTILLNAKILSC